MYAESMWVTNYLPNERGWPQQLSLLSSVCIC